LATYARGSAEALHTRALHARTWRSLEAHAEVTASIALTEPAEAAELTSAGVASTEVTAAVAATDEVRRIRFAAIGAGIAFVIAAAATEWSARQTALGALRAGQRLTATRVVVLAGQVARGALLAAIRRVRSAGFTLRHAFQTLLERIARLLQLLSQLLTVIAELLAEVFSLASIARERLALLH